MIIRRVYGVFPAFVFKVKDLERCMTIGNIMLVDTEATQGVIEHELVHIKQNYRTLGFATVLYKFSQYFRLKFEIEAYKKEIEVDKLTDLDIIYLAETIAEDYNIDYITVADIYASLKG